jgi:hypothetical protein
MSNLRLQKASWSGWVEFVQCWIKARMPQNLYYIDTPSNSSNQYPILLWYRFTSDTVRVHIQYVMWRIHYLIQVWLMNSVIDATPICVDMFSVCFRFGYTRCHKARTTTNPLFPRSNITCHAPYHTDSGHRWSSALKRSNITSRALQLNRTTTVPKPTRCSPFYIY